MMQDFGFYLVMTNPKVGYVECAKAAVKAGVKIIQLRMKHCPREEIVAVDLLEWARANRAAFGETDEESARRIASGIRMLALGMRGKTKRANTSYKGWRLLALPQGKTDCKEDPS